MNTVVAIDYAAAGLTGRNQTEVSMVSQVRRRACDTVLSDDTEMKLVMGSQNELAKMLLGLKLKQAHGQCCHVAAGCVAKLIWWWRSMKRTMIGTRERATGAGVAVPRISFDRTTLKAGSSVLTV